MAHVFNLKMVCQGPWFLYYISFNQYPQ